jgi:DnaJ family protein C protein 3
MKAKIHLKDGSFTLARQTLKSYKVDDHKMSRETLEAVGASEGAAGKAGKARKVGLWNVCVESASDALGAASHSVTIRQMRTECALAAGDVEAAVADLMCVLSVKFQLTH